MKAGDLYRVSSGEFAGQIAKIVSPNVFPDSDLNRRRKITVSIGEEEVYLLPRLLGPVDGQPSHPVLPHSASYVAVPHPVTSRPVYVPGNITDSDDPRLDPWRPDAAILDTYIGRTMMNGMTDTEFLLSFWERRENVVLVGDTQSGKTMLIEVLAVLAGRKLGRRPLPVFTLSGSSGISNYEIFGQTTAYTEEDGTERLVFLRGTVDLAARVDHALLYLDELDHMTERVTSALHSVLDHRRVFVNHGRAVKTLSADGGEVFAPEIVSLSEGLWIVSTVNPGYQGNSLGWAVKNRFTHIPWSYDEAIEKVLVPLATVRLLGKALREARAKRVIQTPVGTTVLARTSHNVTAYGPQMALWMFVSTFPEKEQAAVQAIITDRSITTLLADEVVAGAPAPATVASNSSEELDW
jgi:MoxR-like ATPase